MTFEALTLPVIPSSRVTHEGTGYALIKDPVAGTRHLAILGNVTGFTGERKAEGLLIAPCTAENARILRQRLPWLQPGVLGLRTSAGFGDRLGLATPGHVQSLAGSRIAPIFAQQSVRENTRTGRTPQEVLDDAMWGVFEAGWRETWGADADHLKSLEDIPAFVAAGYTFYTIDPGDYVDDSAQTATFQELSTKVEALPWEDMQTSLQETIESYNREFQIENMVLSFDQESLYRALAKYGGAVAHTARMARRLQELMGGQPFEMEMSVDETGTTTSLLEHLYIVAELQRLNIPFVSLAPRFVGRFEKGVDYIGDMGELEENLAGHASLMRYFGESYKLSLHTGSDKFGVYTPALYYTNGLIHLKTAGTSYLESLRLLATLDPDLFRSIWDFTRSRYEEDRRTYHVSARVERTPAAAELSDERLPALLELFHSRQILHVTFGSVLDTFGERLEQILNSHQEEYHAYIRKHFIRHLSAFQGKERVV